MWAPRTSCSSEIIRTNRRERFHSLICCTSRSHISFHFVRLNWNWGVNMYKSFIFVDIHLLLMTWEWKVREGTNSSRMNLTFWRVMFNRSWMRRYLDLTTCSSASVKSSHGEWNNNRIGGYNKRCGNNENHFIREAKTLHFTYFL